MHFSIQSKYPLKVEIVVVTFPLMKLELHRDIVLRMDITYIQNLYLLRNVAYKKIVIFRI